MNREHIHLLMNRAVDGVASAEERNELARALKADPLLRSEFEDHEAVHTATTSLFRQLALPEDFSKRVMRRIQGGNVPSDADEDSVRLPATRPLGSRASRVVSIQRRRTRVYAIVAFVSAAAALILALGVVTGAFSGNVAPADNTGKTAADGRRGVPDRGDLNRTESPTPQPLPNKGSETPKGDAEVGAPEPEKSAPDTPVNPAPRPDDQVDKPEGKQPEQPADPVEPEPTPEEIVDGQPDGEPTKSEPEPTQPKERDTNPAPGTRTELGRMLVLNGRVDRVGADGSLTRLNDNDAYYSGDRLRTKYNSVVMLQLAGADVTLGKDTQVVLDTEGSLSLEEYDGKERGLVAVDRSGGHDGSSFEVRCGEYSLFLMNGAAVLERKRRALNVSKAVGFATLTHETLGSILFPEDSGYEAEVEFGKEFPQPKAKAVQLPIWCGETRAQTVMLAINGVLAERKFGSNRERSWVNSNLPGKLDNLMTYPTTTDSVVEFLTNAVKREQLDGAAIVKMTGEVEIAYADVPELTSAVITHHAARAALVAESFEQWREYFYRLMRPPVEPKEPKNPVPVPDAGGSDCPNDKKMKRVDEPPPRKVIKPVPPEGAKEDPAKDPAEEDPAEDPADKKPAE